MRLSESQMRELSLRVPANLWPWAVQAVMWVTSEQGRGEYRRGLLLGGQELRARDFARALARAVSTSKKRLAELEKTGFLKRERGQHGSKMWVMGLQKFEDAPEPDEPAMGGPSEPTYETDTLRGVPLSSPEEPAMGGDSEDALPPDENGSSDVLEAVRDPSEFSEPTGKEVLERKTAQGERPPAAASGSAGRPPKAENPPAVGDNGPFRSRTRARTATANGERLSREEAAALDYYPGKDRCGMNHEEWARTRKDYMRAKLHELTEAQRSGQAPEREAVGVGSETRLEETTTIGEDSDST